jgi:hypothetical protein
MLSYVKGEIVLIHHFDYVLFGQPAESIRSAMDAIWGKRGGPPCRRLTNNSKNNVVGSNISWPARSPDSSAFDVCLWGYLKRKGFQTRSADLHSFEIRISEERNAISRHVRVMESVMDRLHQCINLDGRCLTGVVFTSKFVVMFLSKGSCLSSHVTLNKFKYILVHNCVLTYAE